MSFELLIFYGLSALVLGAALCVVMFRNLMHSALALMACLFGVAGFFLTLAADFLAAAQVMVYLGGVTVLILFVVMLTTRLGGAEIRQVNDQAVSAFIVSAVILGTLGYFFWMAPWPRIKKPEFVEATTASIGRLLLTKYLLPFEVISAILIAAMLGAIVLTLQMEKKP